MTSDINIITHNDDPLILDCDDEGDRVGSSRGVVDMESKKWGSSLYVMMLISDVIEDWDERCQAIGW
jgi:hypothetical protein